MSHETFALNLCKANAELQLEFGRLLLENAQRNLELLQRGAAQGLADAKAGPNGPEPTHFREVFRTRGPSNYFLGKQAELI